jgi:hypothetical protein
MGDAEYKEQQRMRSALRNATAKAARRVACIEAAAKMLRRVGDRGDDLVRLSVIEFCVAPENAMLVGEMLAHCHGV